jgi:hypothetical protein
VISRMHSRHLVSSRPPRVIPTALCHPDRSGGISLVIRDRFYSRHHRLTALASGPGLL